MIEEAALKVETRECEKAIIMDKILEEKVQWEAETIKVKEMKNDVEKWGNNNSRTLFVSACLSYLLDNFALQDFPPLTFNQSYDEHVTSK